MNHQNHYLACGLPTLFFLMGAFPLPKDSGMPPVKGTKKWLKKDGQWALTMPQ
jgi:hypothetical protein